jgi:CubicO group peptidase (beta-lactamase class C family)
MTQWRSTLSDRLTAAAARHDVPGASVAVGYGDDLVEAVTGVLNRDTGAEVTTDSLFHVGSATKPWTAALVLQLAYEGAIDLDAPIVRYLPDFGVADPDATARVTARHLLAHTGGFAGDLFLDTGDDDNALDRYLDRIRTTAVQLYPPGALYSYCNSGYCVLGALVARLRGATWERVVRERLAQPLGARHLAFSDDEAREFVTATGHLPAGGDGPLATVSGADLPRSNAPAGSIMRAAPRELVRFGRMLCTGSPPVLPPEAGTEMRSPQATVPGAVGRNGDRWGLGLELWNWSGAPMFGHDGDVPGESTVWRVLPDHDFVVAMSINTNAASGMIEDFIVPLVRDVTGVPAPPWPVPSPSRASDAGDSSRFAGRYATPLYDFEVTPDGADLIVKRTPKGLAAAMGRAPSSDRYAPLSGGTFISADHDTVTFIDGGRYLHAGRAAPRIT